MRHVVLLLSVALLTSCAGLSHYAVLPSSDRIPLGSGQLVTVDPTGQGFRAVLVVWERTDNGWQRVWGPWPAVVGRNGFALPEEKKEGDGRTPSGVFQLRRAFGREESLKTGLDYRQSTKEDHWVDDAKSFQYNRWVHGVPQASSYEDMLRPDGLYDEGAVIEYNTEPVVPGLGSAIFIHIWREDGRKPTAGCVALSEQRLRRLLAWLDSKKSPMIRLGPAPRSSLDINDIKR